MVYELCTAQSTSLGRFVYLVIAYILVRGLAREPCLPQGQHAHWA